MLPDYSCADCNRPVIVLDGTIIRGCSHASAAVLANMSAVMYGKSALAQQHPEALKLMNTEPAQGG